MWGGLLTRGRLAIGRPSEARTIQRSSDTHCDTLKVSAPRPYRHPHRRGWLPCPPRRRPPHPLAPLTAAEIRDAAKSRTPARPRQRALQHHRAGRTAQGDGPSPDRRRRAAPSPSSTTWTPTAPGKPSPISARAASIASGGPQRAADAHREDSARADQIVRADPGWQHAMEARGIRDLNNVVIVAWTAGYFDMPGTSRTEWFARFPYYAAGNTRNYYAHPVEGTRRARQPHHRQSPRFARYRPQLSPSRANPPNSSRSSTTPAPLARTHSPSRKSAGPGFRIENGEVRWEKWHFRLCAAPPRRPRPLHRGLRRLAAASAPSSIADRSPKWWCPTAIPSGGWFFRNSFDAGELGLGSQRRLPHARRRLPRKLLSRRCRARRFQIGTPCTVPRRRRALRAGRRHRLETRRRRPPRPRPSARLRLHRRQLRLRLRLDLPPERHPRNARGAHRYHGRQGDGRWSARSLQPPGRQKHGSAAPPALFHLPPGHGCRRPSPIASSK